VSATARGQVAKQAVKVDPTFGTAIRHARIERDMTQEDLAFAADLAVSSLGQIERGRCAPTWNSAEAIAGALGLSVSELVPANPLPSRRKRRTPPGENSAIGQTVRRLREERGLSQRRLASDAYLTVETIHRMEQGPHNPHMNTMQAIADGLQLSLPELIEAIERTRAEAAAP
jgi:transcriptional regulator with XRE-family HTH domain